MNKQDFKKEHPGCATITARAMVHHLKGRTDITIITWSLKMGYIVLFFSSSENLACCCQRQLEIPVASDKNLTRNLRYWDWKTGF